MAEIKRIFIIAGEHSGDLLGGKLVQAIKQMRPNVTFEFRGVAGEHMQTEGCPTIFPIADVAVMGPAAILARLPKLISRVYQTVDDALAFNPHLVIIIDSPEFTHPIAKRIRKRRPEIPIVDYVSPSVWAWRPGRARKMQPYIDHLLALLPFEPEAHARLGGPACTYVGHPLIEKVEWIDQLETASLSHRLNLAPGLPVLAVLPGSRSSEVSRLMVPFGETITKLRQQLGPLEIVLPTVPSVRHIIEKHLPSWPQQPHLVETEEDKFRAFKLADAALAASGTVTLELAVVGTPMVVAYRLDALASRLRFLLQIPSVVLANLVLGENHFPEYIQENCTPAKLSDALLLLFEDSPEKYNQERAVKEIRKKLALPEGSPSQKAAEVALSLMDRSMRSASNSESALARLRAAE